MIGEIPPRSSDTWLVCQVCCWMRTWVFSSFSSWTHCRGSACALWNLLFDFSQRLECIRSCRHPKGHALRKPALVHPFTLLALLWRGQQTPTIGRSSSRSALLFMQTLNGRVRCNSFGTFTEAWREGANTVMTSFETF